MSQGWKKYPYDYAMFGQKVRAYRLALDWSFGDLSSRTAINKGTLKHIEVKGRSLPESDRMKIIDVFSEALKTSDIPFDRREFLKLAGLASGILVEPKQSAAPVLLRYSTLCLELTESHIADLEVKLYRGEARSVMEEAQQWYRKLIHAGLSETDPNIASTQIKFGLLLGKAQEAALPWYQRCKSAVWTYNDVEKRIIRRFPLNQFQAEYAKLLALRAPMYRELGAFEKSLEEFDLGLFFTQRIGDPYQGLTVKRNLAHLDSNE